MKKLTSAFFYLIIVNFWQSCRGNDSSRKTYILSNNHIQVDHYNVHIAPNLEPYFKFTGKVSIRVYIYSKTDYFTLNCKNLEVKDIKIYSDTLTYLTKYELMTETEMLRINVSPFIEPITYITMDINFVGEINNDFKGLYKIQYTENDLKKWLLATQLEPTYARMIFPCFDEPEYRARFTLSVSVLTDQNVLTLTDQSKEEQIDNRKIIHFDETMLIPTYMLSIVVHQFTETREDDMEAARIYSKNHEKKYSDYFLFSYNKWLTELEGYFEFYFNDHRMNAIPVPDADEYQRNAGLMIFKESNIFHIEEVDVDQHKEEIARTAIHKLSQLWLSVLTTIKWWDNTWLRESSATFLEYVILGKVQPMWRMDEKFLLDVVQTALFEEDNIDDTSLSSSVDYVEEIQSRKFNSLINKKGASILAMLQNVVTSKSLQKAFGNIITNAHSKHDFIKPNDLWNELQKQMNNDKQWAEDLKIQSIMNSWMSNYGYPLIKVITIANSKVEIEQKEYCSPISLTNFTEQSWIIPVFCITPNTGRDTKPTLWLNDKQKKLIEIELKENEWILCNPEQTGYYRVHYNEKNWNLLIHQLKTNPNKIHVKSRAQLIDDSFHLAIYEKLDFLTAFELGMYLKNEEEMLPWLSLTKFATYLLQLYEETSVADSLKEYFGTLFQHTLQKIGFTKTTNEDYSVTTARPSILKVACSMKEQHCIQTVTKIYEENLEHLTRIPPDQKYVVYCNSLSTSNNKEKAWTILWNLFEKSQIMSEREMVLKSLACADDQILLKRYIQMALKQSTFGLNNCEKDVIIKSAGQSFKGVVAALDVIAELIPQIENHSQDNIQTLRTIGSQISSHIQSMEHLNKLTQIITELENKEHRADALLNILKRSHDQGLKILEYKEKHADGIKQAIYNITGYMPSSTMQPPTSNTDAQATPSLNPGTNIPITESLSTTTNTNVSPMLLTTMEFESEKQTKTTMEFKTEKHLKNISQTTTELPSLSSSATQIISTKFFNILLLFGVLIKYEHVLCKIL